MMSLFPADRPSSRTWSMVTQMAWETAKVSRAFSLLSSLLRAASPPPPYTIPPLPVNSVPLFPQPSVSFSAAVTFLCPVCSTLTILLSFSLFHPSVPLSSRPPASLPLLCLCSHNPTPPHSTPFFQTGCCVHLGSLFADGCESTAQTLSCSQGEIFFTCVSLKAHLQTQNKTWLCAQLASKVLTGVFSTK